MGRPIIDHTGQRFGRLEVVKLFEVRNRHAYWVVRCDCGTVKTIKGSNLKRTFSCGCIKSDSQKEAWKRRREKAESDRREGEMRILEEQRHDDEAKRQMLYNQRVGMQFDDFWMFGHDGEAFWNRITSSITVRQSPGAQ